MGKKVYLAGKMSNLPYFNVPTFLKYGSILEADGHTVFNPAKKDIERAGEFYRQCPTGSRAELEAAGVPQLNYRDCMKLDLNWIMDEADAIALIPGWETSPGAKVEKALAELLQLEVIFLPPLAREDVALAFPSDAKA
jgi:hypothetical protein